MPSSRQMQRRFAVDEALRIAWLQQEAAVTPPASRRSTCACRATGMPRALEPLYTVGGVG